ncbi:MAG: LytTR family DNA-binding domain-containing protein [Spirochaetales bacterium]|nr:LytTR family DNA-binding domain-containing protein [Spirochaetales bacterium]
MIKAVIVDDEDLARDELRFLLEQTGEVEIIGEGSNGFEAVARCRSLKPELVFLDIQMPGKDGLEAAREIIGLENPPSIIFQTAYDEFALQAFEVHAMDYLLKPLSPLRLRETLSRLSQKRPEPDRISALINTLARDRVVKHHHLSLYRGDAIIPVKQEDILFLEARGKEVRIVTLRGEFLQTKPFWKIEECLTLPDFFKCHRSFVINLSYVEQVNLWVNNSYIIKLHGLEERIPVSRAKMSEFKEIFHI